MDSGRCWLWVVMAVGGALHSSALPVPAAEKEAAVAPQSDRTPQDVTDAIDRLRLSPLQPADEVLEPFDPLRPASATDEAQAESRAWFLAGKIHEVRGAGDSQEYARAVSAYRRSIALAPTSLAGYQAIIPVLYAQGEKDESRKFALQAARETDEGFRIVRGLAAVMVRGESLDDAVKLLRDALDTSELDPRGVIFLTVQRDLGLYLRMSEHPVGAAESYRRVFDALRDETSPLTAEQRKELLGDAGATYDEIGKTFLAAKLPDLAVEAFGEAAKHREDRPGIHSFNLALVFRETGKPEEGLAELNKYFAAQLQTKGREAYELLAGLLTDLGREKELVPQLAEMLEADASNAALAYFLSGVYLAQGDIAGSEALYTKTLAGSTDPRGLVGLVSVYRRQRKPRDLIRVLGQLYPQMPETQSDEDLQKLPPDVRNLVEQYHAELKSLAEDSAALDVLMTAGREMEQATPPEIDLAQAYMLGKVAVPAKRTDDVVHFYRLTISMLNNPTLDVYRELGEYLIDVKQYAQAADVFREAADHPAFQTARWIFLYFLSYPLEYDGKTEEALKVIVEARGSEPDDPRLHFQQGWIHYHAQQWDQAEPLFLEVIEQYESDPKNEDVVRRCQFSLSNIYVQQGDKIRGEQVLQDVLQDVPDNPQANNDLGYLWADQGKNLPQAREMIQKALAAEPENPAYLDSMGWVLYRLEEFEEARKHLQQAIESPDGEDATIFDHLGDCLDKLGRRDEAVTAWQKAVKLEREKAKPDDDLLKAIEGKLPDAAAQAETKKP